MGSIKESLSLVKDGLQEELAKVKRLKGKPLKEFKNVFDIEEDIDVFFNDFNIIITELETYQLLAPYLGEDTLVMKIEIPEHNSYLWVHQYFNKRIFNDYLK